MKKYNIENAQVIKDLEQIGKEIRGNKEWIVDSLFSHSGSEKASYAPLEEELYERRLEVIEICGKAFSDNGSSYLVEEWAKKLGKYGVSKGASLTDLLPVTKVYRKILWEFIEDFSKKRKVASDTVFKSSLILNDFLDEAAYAFTAAFIEDHEEKIKASHDFIKELSAPVVPISKGIAVLPLIGHLDEDRSAVLMDTVVRDAMSHKLELIFIDLSGVLVMDTFVASRLSDLMKTLKILGVSPILSGLRPETAQTIVSLGIEIKHFKIVSNLRQALIDYGVCKDI
ncbi:STAS domain-containing protein [Salipaludibacillus aurantiacus]|uniref:RsbT co-antagonist protein RsbR n=1 Tax=Salipaludibacillus aurantiacus TaxID=1601833 RepID=A0A1H9NWN7_9BACI|nr:STAS domain-containing protein [Salipaludibacillus aurantiacus]SER40281.1 rsbT co-antagonist protein RsbR [Salipaludibacillus aurantiacus]